MKFKLDNQLDNDCEKILETDISFILLSKNSDVKWFIIVPKTTEIEWYDLSAELQYKLNLQINILSEYLKIKQKSDKINIANLGNVVKQMHIHVVGRKFCDVYWPNPVWRQPNNSEQYKNIVLEKIKLDIKEILYDFI